MCNFSHLHNHTEYSLLDGASTVDRLLDRVVELGQKHFAITDHGSMMGAIEFYRAAKKRGIHPVLGSELYGFRFGTTIDDKNSSNRKPIHLLALAQNNEGYKNLMLMSSLASQQGFYYKPRVDYDIIEQNNKGIITTTGCMAAEIPAMINAGRGDRDIKHVMSWWVDVFSPERYFVELQYHKGIPELNGEINLKLIELAKHFGLKTIITNDVHYARQEDALPHDMLLCVQTRSKFADSDRMRFTDDEYYIQSEEEIRRNFSGYADFDESWLTNTIDVAESCQVEIEDKHEHIPAIEIAPIYSDYDDALKEMSHQALPDFYTDNIDAARERLDYELQVISETGYSSYYLIIKDLLDYARSENILFNCRGSGAGSIVSYLLGLSFIDPLEHSLLFERFINPVRVTMPDFDMDFPDVSRSKIIEYIIGKYGKNQVAQVSTVGRMKARMCLRDVCRSMGITQVDADVLVKKIMNVPGKDITIEGSLDPKDEWYSPEFKTEYDKNDWQKKAIDFAKILDGLARHTGVHAAAIMIGDAPLTEYTPVLRGTKTSVTDTVTEYEYTILESLGLLKVDVLGLATLSIIQECLAMIGDENLTYENIPLDDPIIYDLLSNGDVGGVFQVESHGMRRILTKLKPTRFGQIMDVISLYRPGPLQYIDEYIDRSHGKTSVRYDHLLMKDILSDTQGIMIYQEQVMQVLQSLAGFSLGEADIIRKGMGKKLIDVVEKGREDFINGCKTNNGIDESLAQKIYADIIHFAGYGFNRSHAASYARIAAITAWLKAKYPLEFMTSCLRIEHNKKDKVLAYTMEARRMGIDVLPPSIVNSGMRFSIIEIEKRNPAIKDATFPYDIKTKNGYKAIRFGLDSISQVSDVVAQANAATRIESFADLLDLPYEMMNARSLRSLIAAGAMDDIADRSMLLANVDELMEAGKRNRSKQTIGQLALVDQDLSLPNKASLTDKAISALEKEALGTWCSYHPIDIASDALLSLVNTDIKEMSESEGEVDYKVLFLGILTKLKAVTQKDGRPMALVDMSDLNATISGYVFADLYSKVQLEEGKMYIISGRVSYRNSEPAVIIDSITDKLAMADKNLVKEFKIKGNKDEIIEFLFENLIGEDKCTIHIFDEELQEKSTRIVTGQIDKAVLEASKFEVKIR